VAVEREADAFPLAFLVTIALRVAIKAEVLIRHAGFGNWLIFLGYAPLISHLVVQSTLVVLRDKRARHSR
jgi:hypothetical protein